jgi:C-terminal processing protease CtpA/Prc
MYKKVQLPLIVTILLSISLACVSFSSNQSDNQEKNNIEDSADTETSEQEVTFTSPTSPDEPISISGTVPFTSPFFINITAEPFILLEDQAGFIARNKEFVFPLEGQAIGPVWTIDDNTLGFSLSLPSVPQGTLVDVDQDSDGDQGLMVFGVAFWGNVWGGPFLEEREGTGWSSAHTSAITDAERDYEITGGYLIIWAPDDNQGFPSGFGDDLMLFTEDDPIQKVPAGYNIVNLNSEPFEIYKEPYPEFELVEGSSEVKDYSEMTYLDAFETMFEKVSLEYPFTEEKDVDWDALYAEFQPKVDDARNDFQFYTAMHALSLRIPDSHIGVASQEQISRLFYERFVGSFGLRLAELSDHRIIVIDVYPGFAADDVGIEIGAEIIKWDGNSAQQALNQVVSPFGPFSTPQHGRQDQLIFLTRYPEDTTISIQFRNPGSQEKTVNVEAKFEVDSYFDSVPYYNLDPLALPVEGQTLPGGIAYINIATFSDDYNLMAQTWEHYIEGLIDSEEVDGLILDLRSNAGGSGGLAAAFAGYFFNQEFEIYQSEYYNHSLGDFEIRGEPSKIEPGPLYYSGSVAVLVSPTCISACEGFAYMLSLSPNVTIIGHAPTAGAFGEVGRGQYNLPGDISAQFPTGRSLTMDGDLLIEGVGVEPDILIPVTYESALGLEDSVLQAAFDFLMAN